MSTNIATSPASSKAESQDYHQVSTEELEVRGSTIYIQKPFDCNSVPTYCRDNYPFVIDCSDLLNVLSSDDVTDFISALRNSISGYDEVLAYAMPDHRIVVLSGLLFLNRSQMRLFSWPSAVLNACSACLRLTAESRLGLGLRFLRLVDTMFSLGPAFRARALFACF